MLLAGTYRRALDDKLRLAIPKPIREQLTPERPLFLTPGLDGCLAAYPEAAFAALAERLAVGSPAAREVREYSRLFYSQAVAAQPDSQWRFRVPLTLAKWADIAGEIVVVGVRDHLELWNASKWGEYMARCQPNYDQLAEMAFMVPVRSHVVEETSADRVTANPPLAATDDFVPRPR